MKTDDLSRLPGSFQAVKRPLPVPVEFAPQAGRMQTREGVVAYAAGDALMTGVEGEHWPIARTDFLSTYEPCEGTVAGTDGQYRKRLVTVWVRLIDAPQEFPLANGRGCLQAQVGDYLVQYGPGDLGVVAASIFEMTYDRL